jgi:transposase
MRGKVTPQTSMLTLRTPEQMVPTKHPLRRIKELADQTLKAMGPQFDVLYASTGRPSIPPERLLKGQLLIALYSVRSERLFCEELHYNMLYRWFLDMNLDEEAFDPTAWTRLRTALVEHEIGQAFLHQVVLRAKSLKLMSAEHFSVDGTLIEAWASMKSFQKKEAPRKDPPDDPGNPSVDFHGEKRTNETHESKTDPDARLMRKGRGKEAKLAFAAHVLMENRNGLIVDVRVTKATGRAEREAALELLKSAKTPSKRATVAADKGYDTAAFVEACRAMKVTPHVATTKHTTLDRRTTGIEGYSLSQRIRKRIEETFGWSKTVGGIRKTRYRGLPRVALSFSFVAAAYNLLRVAKLSPA